MALVKAKRKEDVGKYNPIHCKIKQRRLQILVHSCIYYRFGDSIIEDSKWDMWARELIELQKKHPNIAKQVIYNDVFKYFDGSTGHDLPIGIPYILDKALQLLEYKRRKNNDY